MPLEDPEDYDEEDLRRIPRNPSDISHQTLYLMMRFLESESTTAAMTHIPVLTNMRVDWGRNHVLRNEIQAATSVRQREESRQRFAPLATTDDSEKKKDIQLEIKERKTLIPELSEDMFVDVTVQWFNMLSSSQKRKVVEKVGGNIPVKLKQEPKEEKPCSSSEEEGRNPYVPPPEKPRDEDEEENQDQESYDD